MKQWWIQFGDIDDSWDIMYGTAAEAAQDFDWIGPYPSFTEARRQLLYRFRGSRDEINGSIADVKRARAKAYKG